jgi:hypothetical protein
VAFFLGNLPVALSSSIVMLENGMSRVVILIMWLMLTGTHNARITQRSVACSLTRVHVWLWGQRSPA